ncbi:MAG TPA: MarR family transcriptional regulator [Alphaproteobacteria bacterium]|nr:MarR family transcriptional regulator [Alphaproteobacteria bacterium]
MADSIAKNKTRRVATKDYVALAAFRRELRRFLAFSEEAARSSGLTAQQHQAILAIKGHAGAGPMTVGELADHLMIRHHSAVELVDRLVKADLALRMDQADDRRRVGLVLTPKASGVLAELSAIHLEELKQSRALLVQLLERLDQ